MDIYVLDRELKIVGIIDSYISIIWTTRYFTYGDFELYLSADKTMLELLKVGRYLVRDKDIKSDGFYNVMIIKNREIVTNAEEGDHLIVTGYDLKSIIHQRVIPEQTILSGEVETCIDSLIDGNIINSSINSRNVNNLIIGNNTIINTYTMKQQITGKNLGEAVTDICKTYGYGYDMHISYGDFVFTIHEGEDRSYDQTQNPYVVISSQFDNLLSSDYQVNTDNFANVAVVAGEGEGTARKKVTVGDAEGLDRFEVWVDSRNTSSNDGEITEEEYNQLLYEEGVETLSELQVTTSFTGEIDSTINYVFNRDFFLGDIIQVENDYGIKAKTRIIEVIESEDETGQQVIPTFSEMEVQ